MTSDQCRSRTRKSGPSPRVQPPTIIEWKGGGQSVNSLRLHHCLLFESAFRRSGFLVHLRSLMASMNQTGNVAWVCVFLQFRKGLDCVNEQGGGRLFQYALELRSGLCFRCLPQGSVPKLQKCGLINITGKSL
ncbi:hypothetical protein VWZ88_05995 [Phaeobacter sp. JH20_36]|uniref:hypothetical protein n=1 Tax=unclassified Phaeobacter TaxID=2621772 RepID=UPI003A87CC35